jgi:hypothetical protein
MTSATLNAYILFIERFFFDFSHGSRSLTAMPKRLPATHVAHISQVNLNWELYHPLRLKAKDPGRKEILWALSGR